MPDKNEFLFVQGTIISLFAASYIDPIVQCVVLRLPVYP